MGGKDGIREFLFWLNSYYCIIKPNFKELNFMESNHWIEFDSKCFCFTGELTDIVRKDAENEVKSRNGQIANRITSQVDYLIVGSKINPSWKFGNYGNKINDAITLRDKNNKPLIINEPDFIDALILNFPVKDILSPQKILLIKYDLFDTEVRKDIWINLFKEVAEKLNLFIFIEVTHFNEFVLFENNAFRSINNVDRIRIHLLNQFNQSVDLNEVKLFIKDLFKDVLTEELIIKEINEGTSSFVRYSKLFQ